MNPFLLTWILGAVFFLAVTLGIRYFMRVDLDVDQLVRLVILAIVPVTEDWFIWVFFLAWGLTYWYLIDHTLVSKKILFKWSERE